MICAVPGRLQVHVDNRHARPFSGEALAGCAAQVTGTAGDAT